MSKKRKYVILTLVVGFALLLVLYTGKHKAIESDPLGDSGFDSSYDSGGSWDSGSSSSWDSSSGSGGGGSVAEDDVETLKEYFSDGITLEAYWNFFKSGDHFKMFFTEMLFHGFMFIFIYFMVKNKKKALTYFGITSGILFFFPFVYLFIIEFVGVMILGFKVGNKPQSRMNVDYTEMDLSNTDIDPETVHKEIYDIYVRIQEAWMNFTLDSVKDSLSDELYNQYVAQLDTLKVKNQRNVMSDFEYLLCAIKGVQEVNDTQILEVILKVKCKDYIIDDNTKKVLRGNKNKVHTYTYELHLERSRDTSVNNCPNCGGQLDPKGNAVTCPYCNSKIVRKSKNLVLRKKQMLIQD